MLTVTFHSNEDIDDSLLRFAVIISYYQEKLVLCRHRQRTTWEIPGGHREAGETVDAAARRELWEETGANNAAVERVCVYNVLQDGCPSYGALYYAKISETGSLPDDSEIGEVGLFDLLPENLTYPAIQPHLYQYVQKWIHSKTAS